MGFLSRVWRRDRQDAGTPEELSSLARSGDAAARERLIERFTPLALRVAAQVTGRYVQVGRDDEVSVCLIAFNEAIDAYRPDRGGGFLSFAELVMRRRLIDHLRRTSNHHESPLSAWDDEDDEGDVYNAVEADQAVREHARSVEAAERAEEIARYAEALRRYGIAFEELPEICPRHEDARRRAIEVARTVASRPELVKHLRSNGELPLKALEQLAGVSRKTLERQRKYIIAVTVILLEDFTFLRGYLEA